MDERIKKRTILFYVAGVINLLLAGYVALYGSAILPDDSRKLVLIFFLGFAALDFYFPSAMKKKWQEEQAKAEEFRRLRASKLSSAKSQQPPQPPQS